jgi:LPXTG-motif cell wall-anchored protein
VKRRHSFFKINAFTLSIATAALCLTSSLSAVAEDGIMMIDTDIPCSLTVDCQYDNEPIENAEFSIYLVAEIDEFGDIIYNPEFMNAGIELDLEEESAEEWSESAVTLETYILLQKSKKEVPEAVAEGYTNDDGVLKFTGLETGIYLLTGQTTVEGNESYTPVASLITLPNNFNQSDGSIDYEPIVFPKLEASKYPETNDNPVKISVEKVWEDSGHENERPAEIKVVLFKDGEEYDEVTLNTDNNWKHTWLNLSEDARWQLIEEDVPDGYEMTSVLDNNLFTVTNTYEDTPQTPDNPEEPSNPQTSENPSEPNSPTNPNNPNNPSEPTTPGITTSTTTTSKKDTPTNSNTTKTPGDSSTVKTSTKTPDSSSSSSSSTTKLPQTGQLEWPIPILASGGLILLIAGCILRRKRRD